VAAANEGMLVPMPRGHWSLFETVMAHDVIARLDDSLVKAQLDVMQKELMRLRSELQAAEVKERAAEFDRMQNHLQELTRLSWQLESSRLDVLDRQLRVEFDNIELKRRQLRLEYLQSLHEKSMVSDLEFQDEKMLEEQTEKSLSDNTKALDQAKKQEQESQERLKNLPDYQKLEVEALIAPLRDAVDAQQARIRELQLQIEHLEILAPITGTICAIYRWPGQTIRSGDPIMSIAADNGRYIVTYIHQEQILNPEPGSPVLIKARNPKAVALASTVDQVGSQIELIPQHQRRTAQTPEWGLPVRIAIPKILPKNFFVRPGELVDVSFQPPR
jgi:multidrug resistance efflux pump